VLNPIAGAGKPGLARKAIEQHLEHCQIFKTTGQEPVADIVRSAVDDGFELIVAAGGDGTVSSVADGLAHTGIPLGIIPIGTGNMLARGLGIPTDVDAAVKLLVDPYRVRRIDSMRVEDRFFVLNLGIGVSAQTMRDTARQQKHRYGLVAYFLRGLRQMIGFQPHHFDFVIDGHARHLNAAEIFIANGSLPLMHNLVQGSKVCPDDGKLDVFVVRLQNGIDVLRIIVRLLLKQADRNPTLAYFDVKRKIVIKTHQPVPVQADGEFIGETPVCIEVEPDALRVIVP
jgi:YegS/Rv2252/BmrU family lipid kinase